MNNIKRVFAVVLCIIIVALPIAFEEYLIHFAEHDCIGQDCPICYEINLINTTVNSSSCINLVESFLMVLICVFSLFAVRKVFLQYKVRTLITLKVELID